MIKRLVSPCSTPHFRLVEEGELAWLLVNSITVETKANHYCTITARRGGSKLLFCGLPVISSHVDRPDSTEYRKVHLEHDDPKILDLFWARL